MASNNLAVLQTYLKDIIFSEKEILSTIKNREHIYEIKDERSSLGFISFFDLKAYVFEHEDEAKDYFIKNIDSIEWRSLYEHPSFQRRKPQLVSTHSLTEEESTTFYVLQKGQKNGPFTKAKLLEMVDHKEVLLSDMVSFNAGHSWIKLFQVDELDRRSLKASNQLPSMPNEDVINKPSTHVHDLGSATEAMTSFAFLGNLKRGKTIEREHSLSYQEEMTKKAHSTSVYKWLFFASLVGIFYFLMSIKSHLSSPLGLEKTSSLGEQAEMLTPVESTQDFSIPKNDPPKRDNGINDQGRAEKFKTRSLHPVRPAAKKSFMDSQKFRDSSASPEGSTVDDTNYFYDNVAPMELDPVRSQVSKENYNNAGEPTSPTENDTLFNQEVSH